MVQTKGQSPTPQGEAHEARRLEILKRAAGVFREKGFHAAGMREIAAQLGLRAGALYHYFPSKTELLYACQDVSLRQLLDGARAIVKAPEPARDRLRALAHHHLEVILDEVGGSAVHLEFGALPRARREELLDRRDAYEGLFRRVVRDGIKKGEFREVDVKASALAFLGALNATVLWWRPGGPWRARSVAEAYADLFLEGLGVTKGRSTK